MGEREGRARVRSVWFVLVENRPVLSCSLPPDYIYTIFLIAYIKENQKLPCLFSTSGRPAETAPMSASRAGGWRSRDSLLGDLGLVMSSVL